MKLNDKNSLSIEETNARDPYQYGIQENRRETMKIVIGQVLHETNTFSNVKTTKHQFDLWEWDHGEEIIQKHRGVKDYLGAMIDRCEELGVEIIPTFSAFAYPTGTITKKTYEQIESELIQSILDAGKVDGICLALHGAGVAEGVKDLEGELLESLRKKVGYEVPIVATLDLHGNITEKMILEADALFGVNFYPHTDCYERGIEAIEALIDIIKGKLHPKMHLTKLPLLIPTSTTNLSPAKDINQLCWEYEKKETVLDCTFFHGFPYTDTPDIGVSVLSITNNDQELAKQISEHVANKVWEIRQEFFPKILSPIEGIKLALETNGNPIVINETSDNPGGGAPGDGTHLLREMINCHLENTCFAYLYDPEVAEQAHNAGAGSYIEIQLGGKTDSLHGSPLSVKAYVKSLTDGQFIQSSPVWKGLLNKLGKSVRLQVGGVDIIVCSVKSQVLDEQIFLLHGIDVSKYKIVALKSSQHFRAAFESIGEKIITVDSPGLSSCELTNFEYKTFDHPVYPLNKELQYPLS